MTLGWYRRTLADCREKVFGVSFITVFVVRCRIILREPWSRFVTVHIGKGSAFMSSLLSFLSSSTLVVVLVSLTDSTND